MNYWKVQYCGRGCIEEEKIKAKIFCYFLSFSLLVSCIKPDTSNISESQQTAVNNILSSQPVIDQSIIIGGYDTGYKKSGADGHTFFAIRIGSGESDSKNLYGIGQLRNLRSLWVRADNENIDFSPLHSLTLFESLGIEGNFTKIPDLSGMPSLTGLEISFANLTSLNGIEKVPDLERLEIRDNRQSITDVSALRYVRNLKSFICYHSPLSISIFEDIGRNTSLEELRLAGSGIVDLTGIGQFQSLKTLYLSSNIGRYGSGERCIYKNLGEIGYLTSLQTLTLDETINSVEFLLCSANLEYLYLIADKEREDFYTKLLPLDITPLRNLKKLKHLRIQGFNIGNYDVEHELPNLEYINTELIEYE